MTIRRRFPPIAAILILLPSLLLAAGSREKIQLAANPTLSPDGKTVVFSWNGDLWAVSAKGGAARQLTNHPSQEKIPVFSPDGKEIAFGSNRDGTWQVYIMPASGGVPEQLTFHTQGNGAQCWYPDGKHLLTTSWRDYSPFNASRFFTIGRDKKEQEELLFDDYVASGAISRDGRKLLFTREGSEKYRKGYKGTKAQQIWLYEFASKEFTLLLSDETDRRHPVWKPDGSGFFYCGQETGTHNVWEYDLGTKKTEQCTFFTDDSVMYPTLSRDGSVMVFCRLFDLYRFNPKSRSTPEKLDVWHEMEADAPRTERRAYKTADETEFTTDTLEVVFTSGRDIWVMDTVLREPRQITNTPFDESEPHFSRDGKSIYFLRDEGRTVDVWRARPADPAKYWWQNASFILDPVTTDGAGKRRLKLSPDGSKMAYNKGSGELWVSDLDGKNARKLFYSWGDVQYDWSPDGKWLVYARVDKDSSVDVYVIPADGSAAPYNLSRFPYWEGAPVWSPDCRVIAYRGANGMTDTNEVCWVRLTKDNEDPVKTEKTEKEALEKMRKARKVKDKPSAKDKVSTGTVLIDFDGLHERVRRVEVGKELGDPFWSPKSDALAFTAAVDGRRGTYTIDINDPEAKPVFKTDKTGDCAQWLKPDDQIVWLCDGVPGSLKGDKLTPYPFKAQTAVNPFIKHRVAFGIAWRYMRDHFYDPRVNNRDWNAIYDKYADAAEGSPSSDEFSVVMNMMFGELNGSHLGFGSSEKGSGPPDQWKVVTAHLGVRFDPDYAGRGWKVRDVYPKGPADRDASRIKPGEIILNVDGTTITAQTKRTDLLNGSLDRKIRLWVSDGETSRRLVTIRPISYGDARELLMNKWLEDNEKMVDRLSSGTLGYLHVASMNEPSFRKFETQVYEKTLGKDGLVIDVRYNGGGYTADLLLGTLCTPTHAFTRSREGEAGYPRDRLPQVEMRKPLVVLCCQDCFSNAEIFTHAIKTLGRGKVVGVKTAGGVISTGSVKVMDVGSFGMPGRGFHTLDGQDMERNGAAPDYVVWPGIGEMPRGKDRQLEKGVEVLLEDVREAKAKPLPRLIRASERDSVVQ